MSCLQLKTERNDRRATEKMWLGPWQVQAVRNRQCPQRSVGEANGKNTNDAADARSVRMRVPTPCDDSASQSTKENVKGVRDKTHHARKRLATLRMSRVEPATVSPKQCLRQRVSSICCPTLFAGAAFQSKIAANRSSTNQRWIFELINGQFRANENVFIDEEAWMLVQGHSHTGHEMRYLIVFKDLSLHTIRDLRQAHVPILLDAWRKVKQYVSARHGADASFQFYFHYMPSVFQLHMHVCMSSTLDMNRTQRLSCVLRNIRAVDTWYRDALILFASPRQGRANVENLADPADYKQVRVCI